VADDALLACALAVPRGGGVGGIFALVGGPVATEPKVRFRRETGLSDEVRRTASDPKRSFGTSQQGNRFAMLARLARL
jgi:hypothetical protein